MVYSSLNIQYQSTGVGLLPFLGEIELEQSIQYLFLSICGTLLEISIKITGVLYEKN